MVFKSLRHVGRDFSKKKKKEKEKPKNPKLNQLEMFLLSPSSGGDDDDGI